MYQLVEGRHIVNEQQAKATVALQLPDCLDMLV